jgi:hypothetical protein
MSQLKETIFWNRQTVFMLLLRACTGRTALPRRATPLQVTTT